MNKYFTDNASTYQSGLSAKMKTYATPAGLTAAKPAGPFNQPTKRIDQLKQKGQDRRTAQDPGQLREQLAQERQRAFDKPKFSLKQWFENLSSLEKALVLGAGGFIISRILDR